MTSLSWKTRLVRAVSLSPLAVAGVLSMVAPAWAQDVDSVQCTGLVSRLDDVMKVESAYDLESAIEIDFTEALAADDEVDLDKMAVMSKEEVEAMQMTRETGNNPRMRYVERYQDVQVDDNPKFASAMRITASCAALLGTVRPLLAPS